MDRAGSGKTRAVYERIRQVMTDCPGEPMNLTRSRTSYVSGRTELLQFILKKALLTVRVVGFGRFGYQVYQSIGSQRGQSIKLI